LIRNLGQLTIADSLNEMLELGQSAHTFVQQTLLGNQHFLEILKLLLLISFFVVVCDCFCLIEL
jgi:hypothetical protein